ncbi:MAG: lactate utilization protein [Clostridia bacterium]|nr:lactate utilization protein [Clostridia bacterium]
MDNIIQKTMQNLESNNIRAYFAPSKKDVCDIVSAIINAGDTVTWGGSVTLSECGVTDFLKSGAYRALDRAQARDAREVYLQSFNADAYFCSSNAVTEDGVLYNVDGNANRVAAIAFGPRKVVMIVGKNKIVPDLDAAVNRVKTTAAPKNTVRLGLDTPCSKSGKCVSDCMTQGCKGGGRICCQYLVSAQQRQKDRIHVIIVDEVLGY